MATFVGKRLSKVKWLPSSLLTSTLQPSTFFVTGTSETKNNKLSLWKIRSIPFTDKAEEIQNGLALTLVHEVDHHGSVMGIAFLPGIKVLTCSDNGHVYIYNLHQEMEDEKPIVSLALEFQSPVLHFFTMNDEISQEETSQKEISPCSSISVQPNKFSNPEILTAGEDGKINLFYVLEKGVTNPKTFQLESSTITGACFVDTHHIVTTSGNWVKIWHKDNFEKCLLALESESTVNCCSIHPSNPSILVCGESNGNVVFWDLRNLQSPTKIQKLIHSSEVWEVAFHPGSHELVLSCSEDGSVALTHFSIHDLESKPKEYRNLNANTLGVNSFDISDDILVSVTDNESLFFEYIHV